MLLNIKAIIQLADRRAGNFWFGKILVAFVEGSEECPNCLMNINKIDQHERRNYLKLYYTFSQMQKLEFELKLFI